MVVVVVVMTMVLVVMVVVVQLGQEIDKEQTLQLLRPRRCVIASHSVTRHPCFRPQDQLGCPSKASLHLKQHEARFLSL